MNCIEFKDRLDALIDSELDPAERRAAEEHLGACLECARLRDLTLRIKRIVREKAERPTAGASLRSRLMERLERDPASPAGSPPAGSPPVEARDSKIRYLSASNLGVAAAILIVATVSFFLLGPPPRLDHHAAAEEVRDAYARPGIGRIVDESDLRAYVEAKLGVTYKRIDVPDSTLVSWRPETVAGHPAVRLDYEPDAGLGMNKLGVGVPLVSVFLLPLSSTDFKEAYLDDLQDGHYCTGCVHYEESGTIYCLRQDDLFVAAVSNIGSQSFDGLRVR